MINKFNFAKEVIREAGSYIKSQMFNQVSIEEKSHFSDLVTDIDKSTQDLIIEKLKNHYPNDHIMAEENDCFHPISDGNVWVIDPIDGTVNFIVQKENFAVMIAYFENGVGQFGLIYDVMEDTLYSGGGQFNVYANDKLLPNYQDKPLNRTLIGTNALMFAENAYGIKDLANKTLGIRVYGGSGISMTSVMKGHLLAYFSYIQPWDYAAALIMGEKLGYTLIGIDGSPLTFCERQKIMFVPTSKIDFIQKYIHL
ncbi:hypothetical protein HMPREF9318_00515 [Streptococcus urinalis FB127-CNA-2]|uniref:Inositol monophosphatase family protein n=1 Tax=Streptococcus urinalis 2285-97 TaxID=764291 RepID=G5KGA7_9STRE|nr:inositol monophosphatase family protein [Streptococcus urinalis]EHJ56898.1 inositol monophosphatase family protein [Streptococcus urinalis 2285-97]EKS22317.1 hypothetical protein HMPREF9318_00515 [Streptococcus urinalis FB127-CNA-2]VEF32129.1 inositol monophosphatase family protein [Streptococcus urinalis]